MSSSGLGRVVTGLGLVLVVAGGARLAWELLAPLVPLLVVLVLLAVIYSVLLGRGRW